MVIQKSALVTWKVTEGTLGKFLSNTKLLGVAEVLEGRIAIQKDLQRLEKLADDPQEKKTPTMCQGQKTSMEQCRLRMTNSSFAEMDMGVSVDKKLKRSQQ